MVKLTDNNYELIFLCRHFRRIVRFYGGLGTIKGNNTYGVLVFIVFGIFVGEALNEALPGIQHKKNC